MVEGRCCVFAGSATCSAWYACMHVKTLWRLDPLAYETLGARLGDVQTHDRSFGSRLHKVVNSKAVREAALANCSSETCCSGA